MLKERLKMLRQMIPFMSPSAVKSLNAEMKQIASQLASLSGESGGGNGGSQQEQFASAGSAEMERVKSGSGTVEDRQLKETVEELKSLYRTVLAAIKRKQQSGHGSGPLSGNILHLRVYADMPGSRGIVAVKV